MIKRGVLTAPLLDMPTYRKKTPYFSEQNVSVISSEAGPKIVLKENVIDGVLENYQKENDEYCD
jgi:hypothetical protein